jgi:hypothetical protein
VTARFNGRCSRCGGWAEIALEQHTQSTTAFWPCPACGAENATRLPRIALPARPAPDNPSREEMDATCTRPGFAGNGFFGSEHHPGGRWICCPTSSAGEIPKLQWFRQAASR